LLRNLLISFVFLAGCPAPTDPGDAGSTPDGGTLTAVCDDGLPGENETGLDCGGACAAKCAPGGRCLVDSDCAQGTCVGLSCVSVPDCAALTDERAFECACDEPGQCHSGVCEAGRCGAATDGYTPLWTLQERVGLRFAFDCAAGEHFGSIWGNDVYTSDSSVCRAALHAGVITVAAGGRVVIELWPARDGYGTAERNGITSSDYGPYSGSYAIVPFGACANGVKDASESDVDCGASCGVCGIGRTCAGGESCGTENCVAGRCEAAVCENERKDPGETDVDCGGPQCRTCGLDATCLQPTDCASGRCDEGVCKVPLCFDGVKGQEETDVDCGGSTCGPCRTGLSCGAPADCRSGRCVDTRCAAARCDDELKNGLESGVDCGGAACEPCGVDEACGTTSDCSSRNCTAGRCAAVTACFNGERDGEETDLDCGGACGKCAGGEGCSLSSECQDESLGCDDNVCGVPVANAGTSANLLLGRPIGARATFDCPAGLAAGVAWGEDAYTFDSSICTTAVHEGRFTFASGGRVTVELRPGLPAYGGTDRNGVRTNTYPAYPWSFALVPPGPCANGIKDGAETGRDCGGASCGKCGLGATCAAHGDCASSTCVDATCAD